MLYYLVGSELTNLLDVTVGLELRVSHAEQEMPFLSEHKVHLQGIPSVCCFPLHVQTFNVCLMILQNTPFTLFSILAELSNMIIPLLQM